MRVTRLKSLTLPLLALVTFNMIPQLWLRPVNYTLLCGLFIGYRFTVELFGLPMPNRFIVTLMQVLSGILIWQDFQSLFGEGASGALLTLLTCLKTYELKTKRDYFVNCILCFLVLMSYLLLDQSLLLTAYLLADVALMLSFMYALESELWSWSNLKAYARPTFAMTLKSAPLLVLCFLLFPRFQTGFGAGQQAQAKMGMTDNLSPGAISKLAQSDELVFRASYVRGQPPAQGLRYYKGAILDVANGLNWERTKSVPRQQTVNGQSGGEAIEVYLEPGYERFLFVPENAQTAYFADETYKVYRREGNVFELGMPLKARERYFIFVNDEQVFEPASRDMERFLQVPGEPSDQMRRYLSRMKGPTTGQTVGNIVRGFREENGFVYTLEPPPADSIDQFMFRTRAGFCEHYAAATATMLRHLNIPSRVVTGFQGGDASFLENYVTVRNDDAHAWVEYYDDFSNVWRMIDPTSQVAPLRLSMGSDVLIQNGESWINWSAYYQFRSVIDEVDAAWVGFLLRFDLARQKELLSRFGMEAAVFRALPVFLLLAIVLTLAFLYFLEAQRREKLSREERLYRELLKTVQRETGFERRLSEGPVAWFERLQAEQPGIAPAVEPILEPLILARFGSGPIEKRAIDDVARQLKKLRAI